MPTLPLGRHKATIKHILPATYRNRVYNRLDDGYFISIFIPYLGTFTDIVTANPHWRGMLHRTVGKLMADLGLPLACFESIIPQLIDKTVIVEVKSGKAGNEFTLLEVA